MYRITIHRESCFRMGEASPHELPPALNELPLVEPLSEAAEEETTPITSVPSPSKITASPPAVFAIFAISWSRADIRAKPIKPLWCLRSTIDPRI
jgi:hypothetical protein